MYHRRHDYNFLMTDAVTVIDVIHPHLELSSTPIITKQLEVLSHFYLVLLVFCGWIGVESQSSQRRRYGRPLPNSGK
jgi:hypothetical protein